MQTYDPLYLGGIACFNRGAYFESHEIWEDLWSASAPPAKTFYKGLIQAAVALHHAERGNPRGAWKLYRRSCRALEAYRPCYLGLDLDRFLADVAGCMPAQSVESNARDEPSRPQIELTPR